MIPSLIGAAIVLALGAGLLLLIEKNVPRAEWCARPGCMARSVEGRRYCRADASQRRG